MKILIAATLIMGVMLASSCKEDVDTQGAAKESDAVVIHTSNGIYRMTPAPTIHSGSSRIRIENVETVNLEQTVFTKVTYKPWYGKVDSKSHEFYKQHETQSISLLLPGDYAARLKKDDILRMCFYPN